MKQMDQVPVFQIGPGGTLSCDEGVTGMIFEDLEQMANQLPRVFDLDRRRVRERAVERFGVARMVDEYIRVYARIVEAHHGR